MRFFSSLLLLSSCTVVSSFVTSSNRHSRTATVTVTTISSELFAEKTSDTTSTTQRQPWEFGRFVSQSSKFVDLPFLPSSSIKRIIQPGDVIWEPSSSSDSSFSFGPLDDVVMGGVSSSTFDQNTGVWKGSVTDANNGGFIGIRSYPAFQLDMSSCKGIELKVKRGSGKRFKFSTRDSKEFNGITWTTSVDVDSSSSSLFGGLFDSSDGITTIRVPLDQQIPTVFAKTVPDVAFDKSNVVGVQFAYSKFEYDGDLNPKFELGDVQLQILQLTAY